MTYRSSIAIHRNRLGRLVQRLDESGTAEQFPEQTGVSGAVVAAGTAPREAVLQRRLELAEEDAAADGGAEAAGEAAKHACHGRGDDVQFPGDEVKLVDEGIVEAGAGEEAVGEGGEDVCCRG